MLTQCLKIENFRKFFIADLFSCFAIGLLTVATGWYLLSTTGSVMYIGFMTTLKVIAGFVATLFIGQIVDRYDRRKVLYTASLIRVFALVFVAFILWHFGFSIPLILGLAMFNGIGWTVYNASSRAFIQELIPKEQLLNANTLSEISLQGGMLMSGVAAGLILTYTTFLTVLLIYMGLFLLSGILIFNIQHPSATIQSKKEGEGFFQLARLGIRYLTRHPRLFLFGIVSIIPVAVTNFYNVVLPSYVADVVGADSFVFGIADMFYGVGGLLAGYFIAGLSKKLSQNQIIKVCFLFSTLNLIMLFKNETALLLFFGSAVFGMVHSGVRIAMNTTLMEKVEPAYMGRATAVWTGISLILQAVGASSLGLLMEATHGGFGWALMAAMMLIGLMSTSFLLKNS